MESISKKAAEAAQAAGGAGALPETAPKFNPAQHIPPAVAHELNNVIAIIRGYTDRLLLKHNQDPALEPHLKLISDAAKRAGLIVREAMPPRPSPTRHSPSPEAPGRPASKYD